ncbi:hypothetical protein ACFE04_003587 [Oxalis oulophora]
MGASESSLSSSHSLRFGDEITTVSHRSEIVDPITEKLKSLNITSPILTGPPTEGSLTDILVRRRSSTTTSSSSYSPSSIVDPKVIEELFSVYREWQQEKTGKISKRQEEIENKIEVADALGFKLLQRFNYSMSAMKSTSQHLSKVNSLQVEIGELKGRLTEVISNVDTLCKRIEAEGPESLRSAVKPFSIASADKEGDGNSSSVQTLNTSSDSAEAQKDRFNCVLSVNFGIEFVSVSVENLQNGRDIGKTKNVNS